MLSSDSLFQSKLFCVLFLWMKKIVTMVNFFNFYWDWSLDDKQIKHNMQWNVLNFDIKRNLQNKGVCLLSDSNSKEISWVFVFTSNAVYFLSPQPFLLKVHQEEWNVILQFLEMRSLQRAGLIPKSMFSGHSDRPQSSGSTSLTFPDIPGVCRSQYLL